MLVNPAALATLSSATVDLYPPRDDSLTYHAHLSMHLTLDSPIPDHPPPDLPAVSRLRWIPSGQPHWTAHTSSPDFLARLAAIASPAAPCDVDSMHL